jgi:hypothetical protein
MKNIFKLLLASLLVSIIFIACDNDADRDWTTQEASFKLYDTTLGSNVLYETMKNNPFVLTWDKTGSSEYNVVFSTAEDFANKITLGTASTNTFKTTIGDINSKFLQAGLSPYASSTVYVRVESGSEVSNAITFAVTPYPINGPIITAPTAGSSLVLNSTDQLAVATTITWNDYSSYGVNVKYLVEVAKTGTTSFSSIGEVTIPNPNPDNITRSLKVTNKDLNTAVVNTGATINQSNDIDVRVTATTESTGGSIVLQSAVVTFKVTPYQVDYPDFFLVGGASAIGWTPGDAIKMYKHDNISEVYTYLQPDQFRFLGQQSWTGVNYSIDDPRTDAGNRYFKTVSSNVEFGDHENMKFTGTAGIYKVVIDADFGVKSLTVTPSKITVWDVPNIYLVGSINGWDANNATPFSPLGNGKFETFAQLPDDAQFKFIGQQSWGDLDWGNIRGEGNTGYLGPKDDNGNIKYAGGNNWYKITVDVKTGTYKIEPV